MIRADIRFGNGSIHRCVGRVRNQEGVPWVDETDMRDHIAYVNDRNPEAHLEIVHIVTGRMEATA